ncbi:histone acetyltransferase KAT8-like [Scaptodrosophila lebanonensis]|uniref:Histone acetyltransferase n=1 Tax=Drosophila lebanonensis TaxID=7225 RepID=A0A6J2U218_DROLE|nr:histone acetyltransferase KAT8-like [Scaptodrosophila lebanonensis]
MSVADLENIRGDEPMTLDGQNNSDNYAMGGPPRTPVHDAAAELNASLDISGSTESDPTERSEKSIENRDSGDEFGGNAETRVPRAPRSDDSPVSVDMTTIGQPPKRRRIDSQSSSDSSSASSSSGEQSESGTSHSEEGSEDDGTEEGTDEQSPNTVVNLGESSAPDELSKHASGTSEAVGSVEMEEEAHMEEYCGGDPDIDEDPALSNVPETPQSPTDDGEDLDLPTFMHARYVSNKSEEHLDGSRPKSQTIVNKQEQQQDQPEIEQIDSSSEEEPDDEEDDNEEEGNNKEENIPPVKHTFVLTPRDPRQRVRQQPPSPPPPPAPVRNELNEEIESISSTSDEGSSTDEDDNELDSTSRETITATETTDAEGDAPLQQIDINENPEKIYYIRRTDGTVHPAHVLQQRSTDNSSVPNEYYVHYVGLNRRLDEWVKRHRISDNPDDLGGITAPTQPGTSQAAVVERHKRQPYKDYFLTANENQRYDYSDRKMTRYQKRRYDEINHVQKSYAELSALQAAVEKEHQSITKIKYIDKLQFGKYEIVTWYFSPFPGEYRNAQTLYVCEYCLKYMRLEKSYRYHLQQCTRRHPPGREIYRKDTLSIYEVNGKDEALYCQLLCLMAKLFLDYKALYFDMDPFLFYILCEIDKEGSHIVGYFSKEKVSLDNYNVACILVLPPHQRKGYGKLLIAFSYELSRKEGVIGSPEQPLSDLGRLSYRSYWGYTLLELMKECRSSSQSIKELSELSGMTTDDIIYTLQSMKMIKYWKGQHVICVTPKTINDLLQLPQYKRPKLTIDLDCLDWRPHNRVHPRLGLPPPQ